MLIHTSFKLLTAMPLECFQIWSQMELGSKADYADLPNSTIKFEEMGSNGTDLTKTKTLRSEA